MNVRIDPSAAGIVSDLEPQQTESKAPSKARTQEAGQPKATDQVLLSQFKASNLAASQVETPDATAAAALAQQVLGQFKSAPNAAISAQANLSPQDVSVLLAE